MRHINEAIFDGYYFANLPLSELELESRQLGSGIAQWFSGSMLVIGCGTGTLVSFLRNRGIPAWGLDISRYAIENSKAANWCKLGDATRLKEVFPHTFKYVVLENVCQCLELHQLIDLLTSLRATTSTIIFTDKISQPQKVFGLGRDWSWYEKLFASFGWHCSEENSLSGPNVKILRSRQKPAEGPSDFEDPWLVHHDNTAVAIVVLTSDAEEEARFRARYEKLCTIISVDPTQFKSRQLAEEFGVFHSAADYVLVCDGSAIFAEATFYAMLARFRDPSIGVVIPSIIQGGLVRVCCDEPFLDWPFMFYRSLAYQQTKGQPYAFNMLRWKVGRVDDEVSTLGLQQLRSFEPEPITVITAVDDSKEQILSHYFEALTTEANLRRLKLVLFNDCKQESVKRQVQEFLTQFSEVFETVIVEQQKSDAFWHPMVDAQFYRWKDTRYPISVRVSSIYNRMVHYVTTPKVLFWESDTVPLTSNFLAELERNLSEFDAGISGHYICRHQKRSLAWNFTSLMPFMFNWITPGSGVEKVDAVPHGLLLMNSRCLQRFVFSVLANDPRDFRGPDLVMGRSLAHLNLPLRIHWDVKARHYNSDGTYLEP